MARMIVKSQFKSAWWLPNAHLQTIFPVLFRPKAPIELEWEEVTLPDGDFIDLVWSGDDGKPAVMIVHGLEGSIDSHYVKGLMKAINRSGFRALFMHMRGCGLKHNLKPSSYHSGRTEDLDAVIDHVVAKTSAKLHAVIGFSLGANLLLKWLGEQGEQQKVKSAIAVSVPFDLNDCALKLERGWSRIYQSYLVRLLQNKYRDKFKNRSAPLDVDVMKLNTFRLFDDQITAPLNGFDSVDDYYSRCSCKQFLKSNKTPTLIIHSKDDPFMSENAIPTEDDLSNTVLLELSDKGGHVGFIGGNNPFKPHYWLESRITSFL